MRPACLTPSHRSSWRMRGRNTQARGNAPARPLWRRLARGLSWLAIGAVLLLILMIGLWRFVPPVSTLMLGRYALGQPVERRWTGLDHVSQNLLAAVLMAEDARFCRHNGVDWVALGDVVKDGPSRGASTIAMQTAKNLFLWPQRSFVRKTIEIPTALALDAAWPKRRLLEVYLNLAEWGDGIFGAEAAAQRYFGKNAVALTPHEAALLASALPNPILRNPLHPTRKQLFLVKIIERRMREAGPWLDCLK